MDFYYSIIIELMSMFNNKYIIAMINAVVKYFLGWFIMETFAFGFTAQDVMSHMGAMGAIILAFLLRVALDSKKEKITLKGVLIQAITTISLCFLAIYVWNDFLNYKKGFEIYLFFASLFSVFITAEIEVVFKFGFRQWLRNGFNKIMATSPTGGINNQEEIK